MREAWVRVSRRCQNACVFCNDAKALTGEEVPLEAIQVAIDAAQGKADRIVLSGGEPTMSRHLLSAIQYAKQAGFEVALTTNGRVIQTDAIASKLKSCGLDQIRVSLHGGRRATHDRLVGRDGAWVQTLQAVRCAGRAGIEIQVRAVLCDANRTEHVHLMHLVMMAGAASYQLRVVQRGVGPRGAEPASLHDALKVVSELWVAAKEDVVGFDVVGLDHSVDAGVHKPPDAPAQADRALVQLALQRVAVHAASRGTSCFDVDGMSKDLSALAKAEGGLARAGLRLAALGLALRDAPPCLDGRVDPQVPPREPDHQPGCESCPLLDVCPGLTKKLTRMLTAPLRPKASWLPTPGPFCVVAGEDALSVRAATDLEAALREAGAEVVGETEAATRVIVGDDRGLGAGGTSARRVRIQSSPDLDQPAHLTLHALPDALATVSPLGADPSGVTLHPGLVPALPPVRPSRGSGVLLLAASADAQVLAAAASGLGSVGAVRCLTGELAGIASVNGELDAVLDAMRGARLVILAPRPGVPLDVLAADLRWLAVAMSIGRPVVSSRGPGVGAYVRDGVSGILTPGGDAVLLGAAARALALDATRLDALGVGARRVVAAASPAEVARLLVAGAPPKRLDAPSDAPWPA